MRWSDRRDRGKFRFHGKPVPACMLIKKSTKPYFCIMLSRTQTTQRPSSTSLSRALLHPGPRLSIRVADDPNSASKTHKSNGGSFRTAHFPFRCDDCTGDTSKTLVPLGTQAFDESLYPNWSSNPHKFHGCSFRTDNVAYGCCYRTGDTSNTLLALFLSKKGVVGLLI